MTYFNTTHLPIMTTLAQEFLIMDQYFPSIPGIVFSMTHHRLVDRRPCCVPHHPHTCHLCSLLCCTHTQALPR